MRINLQGDVDTIGGEICCMVTPEAAMLETISQHLPVVA